MALSLQFFEVQKERLRKLVKWREQTVYSFLALSGMGPIAAISEPFYSSMPKTNKLALWRNFNKIFPQNRRLKKIEI